MNHITGGGPAAEQDNAFDLDLPGMEGLFAARTVAPPAPDVVARAQAVVTAAVERAGLDDAQPALDDAPGAAVPVRRRFFRRHWITSAALVAAAATGVAVLPAVDFGGRSAATASAAEFLNDLADRTAAQDDGGKTAVERMKGAPYWKSAFVQRLDDGGRSQSTAYTNAKGIGTIYIEGISGPMRMPRSVVSSQKRMWHIGHRDLDVAALDTLPTDTAGLRTLLTDHGSASLDTVTLEVTRLLTSPASPKLRAAVFRMLAQLPGVRLDGIRKDALGRSGTEIRIPMKGQPGWTTDLLVQARTGKLLRGQVSHYSTPSYPPPTYVSDGPAWKLPKPSDQVHQAPPN